MSNQHKSRREQLHRLRERKSELSEQGRSVSARKRTLEAKITSMEVIVRKAYAVNVEATEKIQQQILDNKVLSTKLHSLKNEVDSLHDSYLAKREDYRALAKDSKRLEREIQKLESEKTSLEELIIRARGSELALRSRTTSLESRLISLAGERTKDASVLYTCIQELSKAIEENEFEDAGKKISLIRREGRLNAKIVFQKLSSSFDEFSYLISKKAVTLEKNYRSFGVSIDVKAKRGMNGIVSAAQVLVSIKGKEKDLQHPLEKPQPLLE